MEIVNNICNRIGLKTFQIGQQGKYKKIDKNSKSISLF